MVQRALIETHEKYLVWRIVAYTAMLRVPVSERSRMNRDCKKVLNPHTDFERMDDRFLRRAIKLLSDDINETRHHLKHFPAKDPSCKQCTRESEQ